MNTNFVRYQEEAQPETVVQHEPVRIRDAVTFVSTVDGIVTEKTTTVERGDSNVNPFAGSDSIFATARNPNGTAATEMRPETLLEIDGLQAPISLWVSQGRIAKAADGTYTEATGTPDETPQGAPEGFSPLSDESMARVNAHLEPIEQDELDGLAAIAVGVGVGRLDREALVGKFSQSSGLDPEQASASVNAIAAEYQANADQALAGAGIRASDLQAFYEWARSTKSAALQEAMSLQFHAASTKGYKTLAAQWLSALPPSFVALRSRARGFAS